MIACSPAAGCPTTVRRQAAAQLRLAMAALLLVLAAAAAPAASAPAVWSFFPSSGAAGTTITIVGSGLSGATSVELDGAAATFTAISASRLQAVIPSGASSGAISVTTGGGTGTSLARFAVAGTALRYVAPAASPAITLSNVSGRTIASLAIAADRSITLSNCSGITILACDLRSISLVDSTGITICNCYIHDSANDGIDIQSSSAILVQGNRMERVMTGVYAVQCASGGIRVLGNYVQDVQGPLPRGQLVQFDNVIQGSGTASVVAYNYAINYLGQSTPEDMINIYQSQGTAATPILVEGNVLSGDPVHGSQGKSSSGSGIMIGDAGGDHLTALNNILLSPGQCGIGIPAGSDVLVAGNMVMGAQSAVANIGMYAWNQYGGTPGPVTVMGNTIAWKDSSGGENDWWAGGGFTSISEGPDDFGDWSAFSPLPAGPTQAPLPPLPYGDPAIYPWAVALAPAICSIAPASGPPGTLVTISGSQLGGATAVTVNGTAATVTADAAGQLTVTVPAGATSGAISVVTSGGTATSATSFTVAPGAPLISSFAPASAAPGAAVTISGSQLGGASAVTIDGVAAAISSGTATRIVVTVPAAATSGPIRVTTAGGTATSSASLAVAAPAPTVATPAQGPSSAVTGSTAAVAALGGPAGSEPAYTYTWTVLSHPAGGSASFLPNGTNASQHATITVDRAGSWLVQVSISDPTTHMAANSGPLTITVAAVATSLVLTPASAEVAAGGSASYSAVVDDQFGQPLPTQPAMRWSVSGGGSISTAGRIPPPARPPERATVTAASGSPVEHRRGDRRRRCPGQRARPPAAASAAGTA